MDILILLLLGGTVAFSWHRIDKLERRVADLTGLLDDLSGPYFRQPPAAPVNVAEAEAVPAPESGSEEPESATAKQISPAEEPPRSPEVEPNAGLQLEPKLVDAERAYADESVAEDAQAYEPGKGFSFDFEDIFGRRLPIWGGGFALAIAGIFLVRFSIEAGLLTPIVRVGLSFLFGLSLLAGAEAAFRFEERLHDPRVRQSLAGAALATLYGAFYLAGTAYGLIGAGAAFVGLAAVTAAAIALSFRFGLPCAVIGLLGGFAAPLLVDSDSANVPLLSFYLALVTGGLAWTSEAQGRRRLGYAALAAGLAWGAAMMFAGVSSSSDFAALGIYLVVLGTVLPAFLHANGGPSLPKLAAGAIATLQMAVLVSDAGFAPLTWGLYLLIGAALSALGWRYAALRLGTLVAAGLGLWLLVIWPDPKDQFFALVAAAQVLIFAGVPFAYHWLGRARLLDIAQLGAVSLVMGIVIYTRFGSWGELDSEPVLAASMAGLALLPGIAFALLWQRGEEGETRKALALIAPAALLSFAALLLLTPAWLAPIMAMLVSAPLIWCYWKRDALALHVASWSSAAVTIIALTVTPDFVNETSQLGDSPEAVDKMRAVLRWVATALPFACMAIMGRNPIALGFGEAITVALLYGVVSQVVPSAPLAWIAALAAIALFVLRPRRIAAWATALAIAGLWAFIPLAQWGEAGTMAMFGTPFQAGSAIAPQVLALRILPLAAVFAALLWKGEGWPMDFRAALLLALGVVAVIALHSVYKQVFSITSLFRFEHYGMGERTVWQAALVLAAYGARQYLPDSIRRPVSLGLIAISLAHFVWFTLVLHNPLLTVQHVGPTPIANWLTLAYLTAIGGLWLALTQWDDAPAAVRIGVDTATMALIALLAYSLLRQVFAGSNLTSSTIEQTESLLISLLGIVLALGLLWWGSWRGERSWRIGSLVLMLVAVVKVFLIDAAGLEGLLRIASFMALGFSLIGIGWVYSRQLSRLTASET
ncbi:DUF2339 domain-containing protein [Erythrobacter sp. THAF29]|uniref:DUF2339 domain-containing protein n=1 Tax=Erythrobacter sp. THAF29 TaxID=2587851 RepID=UPI0012695780|nr:DUF2339 domain-containing protein [Erythrobacter sp. THAF29]QFT78527.1 hypothetical protein FIU90_13335 [Erythrobacter sp. THAF29]